MYIAVADPEVAQEGGIFINEKSAFSEFQPNIIIYNK